MGEVILEIPQDFPFIQALIHAPSVKGYVTFLRGSEYCCGQNPSFNVILYSYIPIRFVKPSKMMEIYERASFSLLVVLIYEQVEEVQLLEDYQLVFGLSMMSACIMIALIRL